MYTSRYGVEQWVYRFQNNVYLFFIFESVHCTCLMRLKYNICILGSPYHLIVNIPKHCFYDLHIPLMYEKYFLFNLILLLTTLINYDT